MRRLREEASRLDRVRAVLDPDRPPEASPRLTPEQRQAELVEGLLAGDQVDAALLGYDLGAFHLAAIAIGPSASQAIRDLSAHLDRRLLAVRRDDEVWAWFGGRRAADLDRLGSVVSQGSSSSDLILAIGEPSQGLLGWRLGHRQARAALVVARHRSRPFVRYAEVALEAALLTDDLLASSLRQLYLTPLERHRDGGEAACHTLRAYLATGCNASSAAEALGVNRRTVTDRIRRIETNLGRPLLEIAAEVDLALRLADLEAAS